MFTTQLMGLLIFLVGLFMLIVAIVAVLSPIGIGLGERILLFGGGVITCALGFYMASRPSS